VNGALRTEQGRRSRQRCHDRYRAYIIGQVRRRRWHGLEKSLLFRLAKDQFRVDAADTGFAIDDRVVILPKMSVRSPSIGACTRVLRRMSFIGPDFPTDGAGGFLPGCRSAI
jgi:hypothetical protein